MASGSELFVFAAILVLTASWSKLIAPEKKMKETNLGFFIHDILSGKERSAVTVAGVEESKSSVLKFGTVLVVDDPVTEGFDRSTSKEIGRAQGLYANSAIDGSSLYLAFSIVFTDHHKYNGSSLQLQGAETFALKQREVSIVGGTGLFRHATGYAVMETPFLDMANLHAVLKFNITLRHF
eukprot:Gb_08448 [translate_table: standard]